MIQSVQLWLLARCKCFKYVTFGFVFQQQKKWSPSKINTTTCLLDMNDHFVLKKNFKIIWKEARRLCESELNWLINSANIFTFVVSFCASGQLTLFVRGRKCTLRGRGFSWPPYVFLEMTYLGPKMIKPSSPIYVRTL